MACLCLVEWSVLPHRASSPRESMVQSRTRSRRLPRRSPNSKHPPLPDTPAQGPKPKMACRLRQRATWPWNGWQSRPDPTGSKQWWQCPSCGTISLQPGPPWEPWAVANCGKPHLRWARASTRHGLLPFARHDAPLQPWPEAPKRPWIRRRQTPPISSPTRRTPWLPYQGAQASACSIPSHP